MSSALALMSCATTQSAEGVPPEGDYADATALECKIENCSAHVLVRSSCAAGPLTAWIWRDVPARGAALYEGRLDKQALIKGEKVILIPVCAPAVEPVQALAFRVDGDCTDDDGSITAQFSCVR